MYNSFSSELFRLSELFVAKVIKLKNSQLDLKAFVFPNYFVFLKFFDDSLS